MRLLKLIHWKPEEASEQISILQSAGYEVDNTKFNGPPYLRQLSEHSPLAVIIDLSRLPSHGREVGVSIRMRKSTRYIPLIFVGGEASKVERVKILLPDATFTSWEEILNTIDSVVKGSSQLSDPLVVPQSVFDAYSETPLVKKLGIKTGANVGLVNEPNNFLNTLGELPEGVTFLDGIHDHCELSLWFVRSKEELDNQIVKMADLLGRGSLWIVWQKKTSDQAGDLSQQEVRRAGLSHNLVDYKICAIDEVWSALLFTHRS